MDRRALEREHALLLFDAAPREPYHGFLQGERALAARAEIRRHLVA